jgi:hypothetical protein
VLAAVAESAKKAQVTSESPVPKTGATGFEPAIFGLTGRHVNRYTTPPVCWEY